MVDDGPIQVGITGATGYVGSLLYDRFERAGCHPVALVRSETAAPGRRTQRYQLAGPADAGLLADTDILVHCAWDLSLTRDEEIWGINVRGTNRLLKQARDVGVRRVVFVSSMSAYEGTTQQYGLSKLASERVALENGHCVVRPGLVYGPPWGGMAGALRRVVRMPVAPLVAARSHQFTVHAEDLAEAVFRIGRAAEVPATPIGLAHPDAVPFRDLLTALARSEGSTCRLVPVPWPPLYLAARTAELLGIRSPFRADSLLGLVHPAPEVPNQQFLEGLGIDLRAFAL